MSGAIEYTLGSVLSLLQPVGAPPIGSPGDIRAQAVRLRGIADGLGPSQALVAGAAKLPGAAGPGATRSRTAIAHEAKMLEDRVHGIRDLAARLDAAADSLESRQQAWSAAFQGRAGGLPGYLVSQAVQHLGWKLP